MSTSTVAASNESDGFRLYTPRRFNATTRQRFFRDRRRALLEHLGGHASRTQATLLERVIRLEWQLLRLDARLDAGEDLSAHAMRWQLAAENRIRLDLRELGMRAAPAPVPTLEAYMAKKRAREAAEASAEGARSEP